MTSAFTKKVRKILEDQSLSVERKFMNFLFLFGLSMNKLDPQFEKEFKEELEKAAKELMNKRLMEWKNKSNHS